MSDLLSDLLYVAYHHFNWLSQRVFFAPQLVILHQAVSVITSLESQVRGKLTCFRETIHLLHNTYQYKFTVVYCESVNLIGYITVFYLLIENSYASLHIAHHV